MKQESMIGRLIRIFRISAERFREAEHRHRAVALTYYTLFAIVPIAALCFGIAKGFDMDVRLQETLMERFQTHQALVRYICDFAQTTLRQAQGGIIAGTGVIVLLWTVIGLATHAESAFNAIWELPMRRNFLRRFSDYITIMLLLPILLVVISSAGVMLRQFLSSLLARIPDYHGVTGTVFSISVDLVPPLMICILFTLIYRMVPNTQVRWGSAILAGVCAGIGFQLLQDGFLFLQRAVFHYNRIYGSFSVLPLFLIWLQWSWILLLFGAEISFVAQNLESGVFDRLKWNNRSLRFRRIRQLAELKLIVNNFDANRGAMKESELISHLHLSGVELKEELDELARAELICLSPQPNGGRAYLPGRPVDRMDLAQFTALLDGVSVAEQEEPYHRFAVALAEMDAAARSSSANRKLREL